MILDCQNISKAFGTNVILDNVSFHLEDKEKMAIVGINGAGKTTLLKIIMQEEEADSGQIVLSKDRTIGYLSQHQDIFYDDTVYGVMEDAMKPLIELQDKIRKLEQDMTTLTGDELKAALSTYNRYTHEFEYKNGYAYESEITGVLKGLGFSKEDFDRHTDTLSGGQKTRLSLGRLLLTKPDIIILDEPTNHLDMDSISWLETFLTGYQGSVILVSHDRYFLDKIVTKVVELDRGHSTVYNGNYTYFSQKRAEIRTNMMKAYLNQQADIKHQEEVIEKLKSFNREKSIKRAESREKMLDKIEVIEKPSEVRTDMKLTLTPRILSGNDVLTVEHLSKSFDSHKLFTDVNFEIKRGEHVAIIGDNGSGKTTLLKILNGLVPADQGTFRLGSNVEIGYYDQEHHVLHDDKTIFEEISDDYPHLTNTEIRNTLAAFQFTGDEVFQVIHSLSGGEKGRVSLAKLMLSEANFLILDEPTNHLDIASKEILEEALNNYTGTILYVSHDRYFINSTASRILELVNQTFVNYIGNYDYYLEKKDELTQTYASSQIQRQVSTSQNGSETLPADGAFLSDSKLSWQEQKEQQAKERKRKSELKKTEDEIALLENRNGEIDFQMTLEEVYSNSVKCQELSTERTKNELRLEELYEKWGELAE